MSDNFDSIIGQEHIKEHLRMSITTGKISQAYLITGESMQGKEFIARIFANALVCEDPVDGINPCGKCRSCIQAGTRNHPDIITVTHDKPGTVSVDDVRAQIVSDAQIKPYQSKWKIYIMNEAEKMTPQAQNALLKTLEEPPEYVVIMLLTTSKTAMLSTVISRCVQLDMRPVEDKTVKKYLMTEVGIPDYRADICTAFARGNIGKARSLAMDRFKESYNLAKMYHANRIIYHSGYYSNMYYPIWFKEKSISFWREFFSSIDDAIMVCMENVFDDDPEVLINIIDEVNNPNFKICLDIGHANCYTKISVLDWIKRLNKRIGHFHIDNNDEIGRAHV